MAKSLYTIQTPQPVAKKIVTVDYVREAATPV